MVPTVICGNKVDMPRLVNPLYLNDMRHELPAFKDFLWYMETSSKSNYSYEKAFRTLEKHFLRNTKKFWAKIESCISFIYSEMRQVSYGFCQVLDRLYDSCQAPGKTI